MKNSMHNQQQGSILIFAVLMMMVILTMGLALAGTLISKLRTIAIASDAIVALYAADSASEVCLYEARQIGPGGTPVPRPLMTNGSDFIIASRSTPEVIVTNSCVNLGGDSFSFRATGRFNTVSRALEVSQ